ncbi:WXG100 family type VII secretion target [Shouchella lonarensis]|uniref:ESAT-6-like protein n=1 Tax=Shouchella lonarensis TaxID=1464122 RepID=A0A1G6HNL4_9BACI|nr:WXG100 family type VII secretion target [Shouchella lonarensis]SDB95830.1 WXG100 family type VII secretion target [Shouchella lonarensis]
MAGQVTITFEELKSEATAFDNSAERLRTESAQITKRLQALQSSWKGEASDGFVLQWQDKKQYLEKTAELLNQIAGQTRKIAQEMQEHDERVRGQIGY